MFHVKLITETRVYICHKNMKSMGFFNRLSKVFARNFIKNILQEMKNGLKFETATIDINNNFINSVADKTNDTFILF